jgi:hypothetical protein
VSKSTSLCQQIVHLLDRQVPSKQVAGKYSWASLSPQDRECLWEEAERQSTDPEGSPALLYTIYRMVANKHPWDELRALALILQLPDAVVPPPKKQDGLKRVSRVLDQLRETLSGRDRTGIQRFRRYKADSCVLRAHLQIGLNKIPHAIQSCQEALTIYQEDGLEERASRIRQEIARLKALGERGHHLLPLDRLTSEQLRIQEELTRIGIDLKTQQQLLSDFKANCEEAKRSRDSLLQEIHDKEAQLQRLNQECVKQQTLGQRLGEDIEKKQSALHFLVALPQAAMAPLWVEVVRLALDQGEIDELTRQALERLALDLPEGAVPLLAEIAARSPEPFTVDAEGFQSKVTRGLALMADARQLKEKQQDLSAAAEVLVEAWDTLLASREAEK